MKDLLFLNISNQLGKSDKMLGLPCLAFYHFFATS